MENHGATPRADILASMHAKPPADPGHGPILLCAGEEPASAARLAEAAASLLADRPVVVLATWEPPPPKRRTEAALDALFDIHAELRTAAHGAAAESAQAACRVLEARGIEASSEVIPNEQAPWRTIIDRAYGVDASAIVASLTERAAHDGSLGATARALAHRAHRPLVLVPAGAGEADPAAAAVFAFDGSEPAEHALRVAARLLRPRPAVVTTAWYDISSVAGLASIAVPDEVVRKGARALDEGARAKAEEQTAAGAELLTTAGWSCETLALRATHSVATEVVDAAVERGAALVVTGTRGRSRVAAALLGSTAEDILRRARRTVLLVPPDGDAERGGRSR